jgi:hypothetical protein
VNEEILSVSLMEFTPFKPIKVVIPLNYIGEEECAGGKKDG